MRKNKVLYTAPTPPTREIARYIVEFIDRSAKNHWISPDFLDIDNKLLTRMGTETPQTIRISLCISSVYLPAKSGILPVKPD